jgi:hypothetical protein
MPVPPADPKLWLGGAIEYEHAAAWLTVNV